MNDKTVEFLRRKVQDLNVWKRKNRRATHKPLLMLYALSRCVTTGQRLIPYREVEHDLRPLLEEFAAPREKHEPYLPFWHLRSDGLWEVPGHEKLKRRKNKDRPLLSEFRKHNPSGGFPEEIFEALLTTPQLADYLVRQVLFTYFPATQHGEILEAIGLHLQVELVAPPPPGKPVTWEEVRRQKRESGFRNRVLDAYDYRCALCGYDIRVAGKLVGIEAAHIQWHTYAGPDHESNGIAVCSLHHRLLDRGAFTILPDLTVLISKKTKATRGREEWLVRFQSQPIATPKIQAHWPSEPFLTWHWENVFHGKV
ncbi:MAG TPA: HNH endonuclease [Acidobacteriota bacterium]|nr:HNH endonuclease [Acidobacteriota bacterium]